jgi:hypothetical protein
LGWLRLRSPILLVLGMVLPLEQGYWDSVLELWLAARSHRKRYTSPRHRPSITRHLLLFM